MQSYLRSTLKLEFMIILPYQDKPHEQEENKHKTSEMKKKKK